MPSRLDHSAETGYGPITCLLLVTLVAIMTSAQALPTLDSTFGCLFLAGIFSTALWAVASVQLYLYFEKYPKTDKWWLKLYMTLIWMLDTARQALLVRLLYVYFVKEFANLLYLTHPEGGLIDQTIFGALINAMVQSVFIMRVWNLSNRNYVLTGALVTVVLGLLAASLTYFGQTQSITEAAQLHFAINAARAMNALVVVADTLIAVALIRLLWSRHSGVRQTNSIIKRLVMYAIGTGLVTGIWGIIGLVGVEVFPNSSLYLLVDIVMPKLYLNCVLASLNTRSKLRETIADESGCVSIQLNNVRSGPSGGSSGVDTKSHKASSPRQVEIKVNVDTVHDSQTQSKSFWQSSL